MALPIAAGFLAGIGGAIVQALATRAGFILAGLGLGFVAYTGLSVVLDGFITALNAQLATTGGIEHETVPIGLIALQVASLAGFFDAINIIIAAYLTKAALVAARVTLQRLVS